MKHLMEMWAISFNQPHNMIGNPTARSITHVMNVHGLSHYAPLCDTAAYCTLSPAAVSHKGA